MCAAFPGKGPYFAKRKSFEFLMICERRQTTGNGDESSQTVLSR
jgi:hypothetical protein